MKPLRRNNGNQHLHRALSKHPTTSSANFMPTTSSSRQGSSVRDCFRTSPSPSLSSSGAPSVPGCAPFVPAFPPPNSSSLPRYAKGCPNSSMPTKTTSSRNSSPNDRTPTKCRPSASPPKRKPRTLRVENSRVRNSADERAGHGGIDHGFGDIGAGLVVSDQAAIAGEPGEATLHHPASRQDGKPLLAEPRNCHDSGSSETPTCRGSGQAVGKQEPDQGPAIAHSVHDGLRTGVVAGGQAVPSAGGRQYRRQRGACGRPPFGRRRSSECRLRPAP